MNELLWDAHLLRTPVAILSRSHSRNYFCYLTVFSPFRLLKLCCLPPPHFLVYVTRRPFTTHRLLLQFSYVSVCARAPSVYKINSRETRELYSRCNQIRRRSARQENKNGMMLKRRPRVLLHSHYNGCIF